MQYTHDVLSICNAIVDILVEVKEHELASLNINKGLMHLVDTEKQKQLLQYFKEHQYSIELGGSAMNTTRSLALLGAKTFFVGMVGKDEFGGRIKARMQELGIDSGVHEADELTGSCAILITPDGERTMNTCLGASCLYSAAIIPHQRIRASKILHFTGYQWSTPQQKQAIGQAIDTANGSNTLVSFDVADPFMVKNHRHDFLNVIEHNADIVFANAEEAKELYQSTPEFAATSIARTGAIAVIKLGAKGAIIAHQNTQHLIAPEPTTVVDTTGAGDMFAAGFLYGLVRKEPLEVCGRIAAVLASDVISRIGAVTSDQAIARARSLCTLPENQ